MLNRRTMQRTLENEYEFEGEGEFENEFEGEGEFENEYEFEGEGEFENEYEFEGEGEFENEFEGEGEFENEYEFEGEFENEYEFEGEFENEYEFEGEGEFENEAFIGRIAALARRLAPMLKKLAPIAARTVGSAIAGPQFEYEMEGEFENEYEFESAPQITAVARALASMASQVQNEAEAEAYAGAMTAATLPLKSSSMQRVSPQLVKASAALTRTLRKSPSTRRLVKTLPIIFAKVGKTLKRKASHGKQITPELAGRVMAQAVSNVLGNPMSAAKILSQSSGNDNHAPSSHAPRRRRSPAY